MKNKLLLPLCAIFFMFASTSNAEAAPMKPKMDNHPPQIERRHQSPPPSHHMRGHRRELPPPMIANYPPAPYLPTRIYPDNRVTISVPGLYLSF